MYRHILALQQVSRRTIASTARRQVENKVPEKQKVFQGFLTGDGSLSHNPPQNSHACFHSNEQGASTHWKRYGERNLEDNGMPVHLKGGSGDALLYRTTMALTVLGAGYVVYELVKAAYPQKKD